MVEALGLALASLFIPMFAVVAVFKCIELVRWVRRGGWHEGSGEAQIEQRDRHALL